METVDLNYLIEELVALPGETEWVEFKENNFNPQEIGEYISALSNSACLENKEHGYLVFGIENESHVIKGTSFKPKKEKKGNQELENWLATQLVPKIDFQINEFLHKGFPLVVFQIDATINTPVKFRNLAYVRVGSYKKELSQHPEKERKIWQRVRNYIFETDYAKRHLSDNDVLKELNFQSVFKLLKEPLPESKATILEKLEEEKLIVRRINKYHITNLGAILFASELDSFPNLKRKAPRVIIYKGKDRISTIKEQQGGKGFAIGFENLVNYVNDKLPSNEQIGRVFRKEVRVYPELAIRELIANAIIHQDFTVSGMGTMIEIFTNRIEITNPGKPIIDTNRFIDHSPQSRNEILAGIMRRIGFCEERGSGIDKVIAQIEIFQLPAPEFIKGDNYTRVILYSPKSLRQMGRLDKIRATYQHCCLKYVSGDLMSNQSLRERFEVEEKNYSIISRIIRDAIKDGMIKDHDPANKSRKYAKYIPYWA